jgi:hypothetical protein
LSYAVQCPAWAAPTAGSAVEFPEVDARVNEQCQAEGRSRKTEYICCDCWADVGAARVLAMRMMLRFVTAASKHNAENPFACAADARSA